VKEEFDSVDTGGGIQVRIKVFFQRLSYCLDAINISWCFLEIEADVVNGVNVCVYCPTNVTLAPDYMQELATPLDPSLAIRGSGFPMELGLRITAGVSYPASMSPSTGLHGRKCCLVTSHFP
jgi:hypothetical protein